MLIHAIATAIANVGDLFYKVANWMHSRCECQPARPVYDGRLADGTKDGWI